MADPGCPGMNFGALERSTGSGSWNGLILSRRSIASDFHPSIDSLSGVEICSAFGLISDRPEVAEDPVEAPSRLSADGAPSSASVDLDMIGS